MNFKSTTVNLLKAAICVAAIVWIARGVSAGEIASLWTGCNKLLLCGSVALFLMTPVGQAIRLRRLLASQGIEIDAAESARLAFAGNFMNFAAPIGSTSGDVYKAVRLASSAEQRWEAAAIVFVDRAIGLGTLLLSVTTIALLTGPDGKLGILRGYLGLLSLALLVGCGLLLATARLRGGRLERWIERLPRGDGLRRIIRTARRVLASPRLLMLAIIDTLAIQIAAAASFLCVALALGFGVWPADWTSLYAFFSAGEIVKALPGPPQGLGTMELAYGFFFSNWATPAKIVSAALAIRLVTLACALPGAALVLRVAACAPAPARAAD